MSSRTRTLAPALAVSLFAAIVPSPPAAAQSLEGIEYRTVTPAQPTATPGKIEVIEFFSYGCPHCKDFYPLISAWAAKLPGDVVLRRVPVGFSRPMWINLARAYYALEASGDLARLDGPLFHAIHEERLQPEEQALAEWVGRNGGHADKFAAAYVDFGINTRTVQADQMAMNFQVDSIPSLAVDGKYVAVADSTQGEARYFQQLLENTDRLILRVRAEMPAAARARSPASGK